MTEAKTEAEIVAALERSRAPRAEDRFYAVGELGASEDPRALQRLFELLDDDAIGESRFSWLDETLHEKSVSDRALQALVDRRTVVWPAIVDALPSASAKAAIRMVTVLSLLDASMRLALPDAAHAAIEARAADWQQAAWRFERELGRRLRAGELDREAMWQLWLRDHPRDRREAIGPLVANGDPSSVAKQLVELLDDEDVAAACARALCDLLPALEDHWIRALADSSWPARYPVLLPALAKHGELATGILPTCVACFEPKSPIKVVKSERLELGKAALLALGPIADRVRPRLVEIFLTVDEPVPDDMPTRWPLVEVLGKARLAAELGDLDALPEHDWYATMRKREIAKLLA